MTGAASEGDPFSVIRRYRLAARSIARDETLGDSRYVALVRLVERGQEEFGADSWLAFTVQRIIFAEAEELLVHGRTPKEPAPSWRGDPVAVALRSLHHKGYATCPSCFRAIPPADTLSAWEDMSRRIWLQALRREKAPEREAEAGPSGDAA